MKKCKHFNERTQEYIEQGLCDHNGCINYYEGICCIPAEDYEIFMNEG